MIKAILFDWGNTIMRDLPLYTGPMVNWPRVEAVDGAEEALRALYGRYTIALATNAMDSTAGQVGLALERVGLRAYFDHIFTSRELEARKPQGEFFLNALAIVGCQPHEAVMVGDALQTDVMAAQAAGLRAVWYGTASKCVEVATVADLRKLPAMIEELESNMDSQD